MILSCLLIFLLIINNISSKRVFV